MESISFVIFVIATLGYRLAGDIPWPASILLALVTAGSIVGGSEWLRP